MALDFSKHPKMDAQPRDKPMEVLCLGLSRTGTMSLYVALRKLGINTYHAMEMGRDNLNGSCKIWKQALEAKYYGGKTGKLETAEDFDQLLWRYQAVTDIPCCLFADELLKAYPDAKVVLTTRDEDGWVRSVQNSFYAILDMKIFTWVLQYVDFEHMYHYIPILLYTLRIWTNNDIHNMDKLRQGYRNHNAHIRAVVPKERLLDYHVSQGWEPLCTFLGKPVPDEPMPKINEGMWVLDLHRWLAKFRLKVVLKKWAVVAAPVLAGMVGFAYYRWI